MEAKLGDAGALLAAGGSIRAKGVLISVRRDATSSEHRGIVTGWWAAVRDRANTPNWDIAVTASIGGRERLALVEAKAHTAELKRDGHGIRNEYNLGRIRGAIEEANAALRNLNPG